MKTTKTITKSFDLRTIHGEVLNSVTVSLDFTGDSFDWTSEAFLTWTHSQLNNKAADELGYSAASREAGHYITESSEAHYLNTLQLGHLNTLNKNSK